MGLDPIFAEALAEELVDPGAPKNTEIVQHLIEMPVPASREEAAAAVAAVVRQHRALKKSAQSKRQKSQQHEQTRENDTAADQDGAEEFTGRIVQIFQRRYAQALTKQRQAEVEHTLVAVGRAFGVYLVRRALLPPKHQQHSQAA